MPNYSAVILPDEVWTSLQAYIMAYQRERIDQIADAKKMAKKTGYMKQVEFLEKRHKDLHLVLKGISKKRAVEIK